MEGKNNYIERYWRDATPEDAIKEPPMVARFRYEESGKWKIELLLGFDRDGSEITWSGQSRRVKYCQVYDAPEPKYIPFTWEDREQLRGRWYTMTLSCGEIRECQIEFLRLDRNVFIIGSFPSDQLLEKNARFLDTGEPVGKRVV